MLTFQYLSHHQRRPPSGRRRARTAAEPSRAATRPRPSCAAPPSGRPRASTAPAGLHALPPATLACRSRRPPTRRIWHRGHRIRPQGSWIWPRWSRRRRHRSPDGGLLQHLQRPRPLGEGEGKGCPAAAVLAGRAGFRRPAPAAKQWRGGED